MIRFFATGTLMLLLCVVPALSTAGDSEAQMTPEWEDVELSAAEADAALESAETAADSLSVLLADPTVEDTQEVCEGVRQYAPKADKAAKWLRKIPVKRVCRAGRAICILGNVADYTCGLLIGDDWQDLDLACSTAACKKKKSE